MGLYCEIVIHSPSLLVVCLPEPIAACICFKGWSSNDYVDKGWCPLLSIFAWSVCFHFWWVFTICWWWRAYCWKGVEPWQATKISALDCLGLPLAWSYTWLSYSASITFCMAMSLVSKYLQFSWRIVIKVPKKNDHAKSHVIMWQTRRVGRAIHRWHRVLYNACGAMDGLKCYIDKVPDAQFYNGWKSSHFFTAVFCFVPDGTIPAVWYNIPGCCDASQVADWGYLYKKTKQSMLALVWNLSLILHLLQEYCISN